MMVSNQSDNSSWNGSLSPKEFSVAAFAFAEKWEKFHSLLPHWSWVSSNQPWIAAHEVEGYLCLQNILIPKFTEEDCDEGSHMSKEEPCWANDDEPVDTATLVQSCDGELHRYDFHIVYNNSYRVPVLYFRAYCSDGQPLMLDDIEKDLPANSRKVLMESKWTFITQEEHPYLNRPWYTLHPCGTSEWMKLLYTDKGSMAKGGVPVEQYMVSWFSVVGQVVGLRLPLEMLKGFRLDDWSLKKISS